MQLASGTSSPLYDPSWLSQTEVTTLASDVRAGTQATIDMDVTTPAETPSTAIDQVLALDDAGTQLGTFDLALTVAPDADPEHARRQRARRRSLAAARRRLQRQRWRYRGGLAFALLAFVVRRRRR